MKCLMLVLLGLATLVAARPDSVVDISEEDIHQSMEVGDDNTMTGSFSWTSPEGTQYFVKYIADGNGFRILESNAVPATVQGVKADGTQGSFLSSEEFDDDDDDDFFDDDDRK
ncbi:cuticle protein 16.8-like [Panulirus ornatus]|uniref:cuticle protein 16.8-like n=1 Tax=Panulirus ornatus TaxID=150431 RepID=UPI003A891B41